MISHRDVLQKGDSDSTLKKTHNIQKIWWDEKLLSKKKIV